MRTESRSIFKYPLAVDDDVTVQMPDGATPLHVGVQRGRPCIWAEVDPSAEPVPHHFRVYGTGHPMHDKPGEVYIGTFMLQDDALVFHVYEAPL